MVFYETYRNSWTLDTRDGRWTLDADHWTLILSTTLILCSQSWRVFQTRNDTLIILQTKNRVDSFFVTGKYHTKKQNITSHLKVFLKRATNQAKIHQKTATVTIFFHTKSHTLRATQVVQRLISQSFFHGKDTIIF